MTNPNSPPEPEKFASVRESVEFNRSRLMGTLPQHPELPIPPEGIPHPVSSEGRVALNHANANIRHVGWNDPPAVEGDGVDEVVPVPLVENDSNSGAVENTPPASNVEISWSPTTLDVDVDKPVSEITTTYAYTNLSYKNSRIEESDEENKITPVPDTGMEEEVPREESENIQTQPQVDAWSHEYDDDSDSELPPMTLRPINMEEVPPPTPALLTQTLGDVVAPFLASRSKKDCRMWLWKNGIGRRARIALEKKGMDHDFHEVLPPLPYPRQRTAEEEAIAQDLLQLSRSLPPLRPKAIPVAVVVPPLTPPDTPNQQEITTLTALLPSPVHVNVICHSHSHRDTPPTPSASGSEYSSDVENVCPGGSACIETLSPSSSSPSPSVDGPSLRCYTYDDLKTLDGRKRKSGKDYQGESGGGMSEEDYIPPNLSSSSSRRSSRLRTKRARTVTPPPSDSEAEIFSDSDENSEEDEEESDCDLDYEVIEGKVRRGKWRPPKITSRRTSGSNLRPPRSPSTSSSDSHRIQGRYTCSECGKHYATSSNLSRHKQTHRSLDSQNAKRCPTCGKAYVSMPALSMHILTHNLNHKCDICGKSFSRPWLLQGHKRSHTGEKPYECGQCGKNFADRSNLRAHMATHSSSKNYVCSRCNKSFALKSYLNKHYDSACFKE